MGTPENDAIYPERVAASCQPTTASVPTDGSQNRGYTFPVFLPHRAQEFSKTTQQHNANMQYDIAEVFSAASIPALI